MYRGLPEQKRLLDAIAAGESTGYDVMYGGGKFGSYADHPRQYIPISSGPNIGKNSSAAGRYQFLASTWDEQKRELGLPDFSADSQDKAAWHLADKTYRAKTKRDLLADLQAGNTSDIASALSGVWTSIPGGIEPNKATSGFNTRLQEGPMNQAFGMQRPRSPEEEAALKNVMAQQQQPGALSAQFQAGPGALSQGGQGGFFQNAIPSDMDDLGGRMQNAGAYLMAINNPGALSLVAANNKIRAAKEMKTPTEQWRTTTDAKGRALYQTSSTTGERKNVPGGQTADEIVKQDQAVTAQQGMRDTLANIGKSYVQLDKMGASPNPDNGVLPNLWAAARSSGLGQAAGQAIGTEDASIRSNIISQRPLILSQIAQATGISAQQLNSNVEFNAYLKAATDPSADVYANMRSLAALYEKFGKGKTSELLDQIGVDEQMRKRAFGASQGSRPDLTSFGGSPAQSGSRPPLDSFKLK